MSRVLSEGTGRTDAVVRILLANSSAYPTIGGVENSLYYMGRELLALGHEVKVFCFQPSPDVPRREWHEGMEIVRCPYTPPRWPHHRTRYQVALVREAIQPVLREFAPDAVWSRSAPLGLAIAASGYPGALFQVFCTTARMNCRGLYLQTRGMPLRRRLMLWGLWPFDYHTSSAVERALLPRCRPVVFSENMRRQLQAAHGRRAAGIRVIPPGVDPEVFSPAAGRRFFPELEDQYGLLPGEPLVLYVGRLSAAKNVPLLVDAVARLKQPARLVLVGAGPEENRLRAYVTHKGLASRVVFAGKQEELLPGFYAIATVCVLPTSIESFGQVYLESLACGTPAVGFAGDGRRVLTATDEILQDGRTGRIVRKVSAQALAQGIDDLLALGAPAYQAMSQEAVRDVSTRFRWRRFVAEMLELLVPPQACGAFHEPLDCHRV